ncbi:MAG: hypothetical protein JWM80_4087 [Cyanobacteria bacterium RYN_339]|nr:hypothetical protein [Cyanobacteria bacterium RYN_339]
MPDLANESTGVNYAKKDASAERLWLTQRTKANPWDHRTESDDDAPADQQGQQDQAQAEGRPAKGPMISQKDTLALEDSREAPLENPFEALIEHQRTHNL